jgi:metal-responsive CopG/Arc/MetJ family transcriptional regulator
MKKVTAKKSRMTVSIDADVLVKLNLVCEKFGKNRSQLVQRSVKRLVEGVEQLEDVVTTEFLVADKEGSK